MTAVVYAGLMPDERRVRAGERVPVGEWVGGRDRRVVQAEHLALVAEQLAREAEIVTRPPARVTTSSGSPMRSASRARIRSRSSAGIDAPRVRNVA